MQTLKKSPLWNSHRFWMQVMAVVVFLILSLSGTVGVTGGQLLTFVLALAGLGVGARTVTGVTGILATRSLEKRQVQAATASPCAPCREGTVVERPSPEEDGGKYEYARDQPANPFAQAPRPAHPPEGTEPAARRKLPPKPMERKGGY